MPAKQLMPVVQIVHWRCYEQPTLLEGFGTNVKQARDQRVAPTERQRVRFRVRHCLSSAKCDQYFVVLDKEVVDRQL